MVNQTLAARGAPARSAARWWILAFIAGAQLMVVLDTTIMLIALPSAQHALGFSVTGRQWVITAYTITFGGLLLLGGRLSDLLGSKLAMTIGVAGFAAASALGGAAPDPGVLVGARALQGIFAALLAPAVLAVLTTTFTDDAERGRAFGIWAAIATAGAALGLILGGVLTQYLGWRWCLFVNVPIAVVVAVGVAVTVPARAHRAGVRLDLPGTVLGCGGVAALVYGLGQAAGASWGSAGVVIPLAVAVIALAAFVTVQARSAHPLLPLRILASRNRGGAYASIALAMFANYGAFLFLTYILQGIEHLSPLAAGLGFLPLTVINGLASTQVASRLLARIPVRAIVVPGLLIGAAGAALFTQITPASGYAGLVLPAELLIGVALGLSVMPLFATATREADPADAGATGAAANMAQQVGASVGTAVLNTIAATATASYLASHHGLTGPAAAAVSHGYSVASVWAAAVLVLAALIGGALITTRPGRTAFETAGRLADHRPVPRLLVTQVRAWLVCALVRLGDTGRAVQALADLSDHDRDSPQTRIAAAALRLAEDNAEAAAAALAPVLDGSAAGISWIWLAHAFLLEAIARDALGDQAAAESALERALDLAEPNGAVLPFLLYPAPGLLERQARHGSAHAALIADILGPLAGNKPAPPPAGPRLRLEPLSTSELRVLRYLPTNLTGPEIAGELCVSHNTVRTHITHLYGKLGTHTRAEAVARARALGLLAPSPLRGRATRPG